MVGSNFAGYLFTATGYFIAHLNVTNVCRFCEEGTADAIERAVDAIFAVST
jgi:hypothetical protein